MATNPSSHLPSGNQTWLEHPPFTVDFPIRNLHGQFGEMPRLMTPEAKSHRIFFDYPKNKIPV